MFSKPLIQIWLDQRRAKKEGRYPVKVRITHQRQRYYYSTNINLTEQEFETALSAKPGAKLKDVHFKLHEIEKQANDVIDKITDELQTEFSISLFEKYLHIGHRDYKDVFNTFSRKIDEMEKREQIKTSEGYESCMKKLKEFTGREELTFVEIDKKFLLDWEADMEKQKMSLTTVGIYMRYLRAVYRIAIDEKIVSQELYPFGRNKYQIPQPANNKRALKQTDLLKILNYKPEEDTWEEYAKDMWVLSLLCQGINMKDIASLRYGQIQNDRIVFIRQKTKTTKKKNQIPITVYLSKEAKAIIKRWGNENTDADNYVFPIYSDEHTTLQNIRNAEQHLKMINKYMRQIASTLKIKEDFTFYAARHSFATTLKQQGRSIEEIQEFIGHSDKKTTERYLASFEDKHKRSVMSAYLKKLNVA